MRILVWFSLLVTCSLFGQEIVPETESTKKTLDLTFRIDRSWMIPNPNMEYNYQGEFVNSSFGGGDWRWIDTTIVKDNWRDTRNVRNIKIDFLLSMTKRLNVGFSYNFTYFIIPPNTSSFSTDNPYFIRDSGFLFTTLGPVVEYEIVVPGTESLQIIPSLSFGSYQSNSGLEDIGREFYIDGRVAIEYVLWERLGIRNFVAYNYWGYRENETSDIFPDRERIVKTDWNALYIGLGLSYRFKLRPD